MQGGTEFDAVEYLFSPSGAPVSDAEMDIIRQRYEGWKIEGAGRDVMGLRDFAEQIYFSGCPAPSNGVHDDFGLNDNINSNGTEANGDLYPDLYGRSSAPVGVAMTSKLGTATGPESMTMDGADAMLLPALHSDLKGVGQERLPILERRATVTQVAAATKAMPSLEAVSRSIPVLELANGMPIAKPMPGLEAAPQSLPMLELASGQRLPTLHRAPELASDTGDMLPLFRIPQSRRRRRQQPGSDRTGTEETALLAAGVPTLQRVAFVQGPASCPSITDGSVSNNHNAAFMAGSELSEIMAATRGIEASALYQGEPSVRVKATTVASASRSDPTPGFVHRLFAAERRHPGGATPEQSDSPRARARLQHAFAVVRDEFAEDPQQFAKAACRSESSLVTLAAELRGALAGVQAGDSKSVAASGGLGRGRHRLLSDRRVRSAALGDPNGRRRAAFVAAASELADGLHAMEYSDEARAILLSAEAPPRIGAFTDPFVRTMEEAWFRLMKQAQKGMGRDVTADTAISQAFVYFGPISSETTRIDRKTDPATAESRIMVWSAMASLITMSSLTVALDKAKLVQDSLRWVDILADEINRFSGMQTTSAPAVATEAIGQTLLTETTIAGKVKKGLRIIIKTALDAPVGSRAREAQDATNAFMIKFFDKFQAKDSAGRKSDFVRAYISAMCGVFFMRDIERNINSIQGLEDLREKYVLSPMRAARDYIGSTRGELPFEERET